MRYLLIIVAVVQLLIGALWIVGIIRVAPTDAWAYVPGALNALAGIYGLRVGVRGRGHLGLVLFNGIILALVLTALIQRHGSFGAIPWREVDVLLNLAWPGVPILLSLVVRRPRHED